MKTELQESKQKILIVGKEPLSLVKLLQKALSQYDYHIFTSPLPPRNINIFDLYFFIGDIKTELDFFYPEKKKAVFIFWNDAKKARHFSSYLKKNHIKNAKVILFEQYDKPTTQDVEKILWFVFSSTNEIQLTLQSMGVTPISKKHLPPKSSLSFLSPSRKLLFFSLIFFFLLIHIAFLPFLLLSSYSLFRSTSFLKKRDVPATTAHLRYGEKWLSLSQFFYRFSRPTLLFFSLAILPDNLIQLNEKSQELIQSSLTLSEKSTDVVTLFLQEYKTPQEKERLVLDIQQTKEEIEDMKENLMVIYQKMPEWHPQLTQLKSQIKEVMTTIDAVDKLLPYTSEILAENTSRTYLLLFANNMELRPGGGFIGSFGLLTVENMTLKNFKIYDVYDADGQLVAHVDPPAAIEKHLNQPHWFLRDSAFSGDFSENYQQAVFFLNKELGITKIDGSILLTTTAIQNIFSAFDTLYLPDFQETINKDNFYLKAQLYSEKDFFPGSLQKKSFLSAVANQLFIQLDQANMPQLVKMIKKSFDEKQATIFLENKAIQSVFDSLYWSGRMIKPNCTSTNENCLVDYLFPLDANLGVNKANFYITRNLHLDVKISEEGEIVNKFTIDYRNDSPNNIFPGGTYKNYFQILLPPGVQIKNITKNGTLIEDYDIKSEEITQVGFLIEIPPQKEAEVTVEYQLGEKLKTGRGVYQLIFQKQIGSPNSDFELTIHMPRNIYLVNQNFTPLVKDGNVLYNTTITADKIFFIELLRETYEKK